MCASDEPSAAADPHAACSFDAWYPRFRSHALRSVVVDLPHDFFTYLSEDGVFVGEASAAMPVRGRMDSLDEDEYQDWSASASDSGSDNPAKQQPSALLTGGASSSGSESGSDDDASPVGLDWTLRFPALQVEIESAIQEMGGNVVPKLNWSCPSDATWVNTLASLSCSSAEQVVLMLKSSDRVAHDIDILRRQPGQANPNP
eukprot:gene8640-34088_t